MKRKLLSLVLSLAMLVSMAVPALADESNSSFSDVQDHWGQSSVERWASVGVLNGTGNGFKPDANMTRAEFAQVLVNMMGYTQKGANNFADVPADAWYTDAVLKLAAAGIMKGDGTNANPLAPISRAEAAVLLCRAFGLESKGGSIDFVDSASVPSWAKDAMAALSERGMISGVGGNQIAPLVNITRASVSKLLDNMVSTYVTASGQVVTGSQKGLVIVASSSVVIKDATLAENLIIAPKAGAAKVELTGNTSVGTIVISSNGVALTVGKDATVDTIKVDGSNAKLEVSGKVGTIEIAENANGATVNVPAGGVVDLIVTSADDVTISGDGTVKRVEILAGDSIAVNTKGTVVVVAKDVTNATANGEALVPGETTTTPGGSTGGGGGGVGGPGHKPGPDESDKWEYIEDAETAEDYFSNAMYELKEYIYQIKNPISVAKKDNVYTFEALEDIKDEDRSNFIGGFLKFIHVVFKDFLPGENDAIVVHTANGNGIYVIAAGAKLTGDGDKYLENLENYLEDYDSNELAELLFGDEEVIVTIYKNGKTVNVKPITIIPLGFSKG